MKRSRRDKFPTQFRFKSFAEFSENVFKFMKSWNFWKMQKYLSFSYKFSFSGDLFPPILWAARKEQAVNKETHSLDI